MSLILKNSKCSKCNNEYIIVHTTKEVDRNSELYEKEIVTHGCCSKCLNLFFLPNVTVEEFSDKCYFVKNI